MGGDFAVLLRIQRARRAPSDRGSISTRSAAAKSDAPEASVAIKRTIAPKRTAVHRCRGRTNMAVAPCSLRRELAKKRRPAPDRKPAPRSALELDRRVRPHTFIVRARIS